VQAIWKETVLADSYDTVVVEGNHYFPPDSVNWSALTPSATTTRCFWKGKASYYDVDTGGRANPDAAWTYQKPWPLARHITGYVAFWHGVRVVE
jgi:uncharacterized protein (DUF427 family)